MRHAVELWHGVILSSIRLGKTIRVRIASTTPMDDVYGFNVPIRSTNLYGSYTVLHLRKKWTNYFTSSDPHHDMLGGGCQVRVVIKNMMGRMENLRTLISGFLGLVILVRWALVTMFLS